MVHKMEFNVRVQYLSIKGEHLIPWLKPWLIIYMKCSFTFFSVITGSKDKGMVAFIAWLSWYNVQNLTWDVQPFLIKFDSCSNWKAYLHLVLKDIFVFDHKWTTVNTRGAIIHHIIEKSLNKNLPMYRQSKWNE